MEVISFMAIKGGVGKTTMAFQLAKFLQDRKKKVLLIDMDGQKSLTGTFESENVSFKNSLSISDILSNPSITEEETAINDFISFIPSVSNLDNLTDLLSIKPNKELLLFMWFSRNIDRLEKSYEYVIIDLPPAWNLLTKNGVAVSDKIISPLDPSRFGYESHIKVLQSIAMLKKEVVDPVSGKSYITATVNFLGNRVKHNTKTSKEFLSALKGINNVIGIIPEKELINASMLEKLGIEEYLRKEEKLKEQEKFLILINDIFSNILEA